MNVAVSPLLRLQGKAHHLRPQVVESLFVLHHVTGNPIYRDWGKEIFHAIKRHCWADYGFSSYSDVTQLDAPLLDKQEPHFVSQTLKFLYLLQSPDHGVSLREVVFNAHGHMLPIIQAEKHGAS